MGWLNSTRRPADPWTRSPAPETTLRVDAVDEQAQVLEAGQRGRTAGRVVGQPVPQSVAELLAKAVTRDSPCRHTQAGLVGLVQLLQQPSALGVVGRVRADPAAQDLVEVVDQLASARRPSGSGRIADRAGGQEQQVVAVDVQVDERHRAGDPVQVGHAHADHPPGRAWPRACAGRSRTALIVVCLRDCRCRRVRSRGPEGPGGQEASP